MLYRKLGKTGEKVSILGFGCMRLPVIDGNPEKIDPHATEMLHYALEHGVNLFDTGYSYHSSLHLKVGKVKSGWGMHLKMGIGKMCTYPPSCPAGSSKKGKI